MSIGTLPSGLHAAAIELWRETDLTRPWSDPAGDLDRALAGPSSTVLGGVQDETLLATAMVGVTAIAAGSITSR